MQQHPTLGSILQTLFGSVVPRNNIRPPAQFLQTLLTSVVPMQQRPTIGLIFTNLVQFSCSHATTSHPRLNFCKPCSVQLPPCSNIPPSAQFLQTLFSSIVPMQEHPTLGSIFTNPVQFRCPIQQHPTLGSIFTNHVQSSCSVAPVQQHHALGSIFTHHVQVSCSHAATSHHRLNFNKPCSAQLLPCSNIPPIVVSFYG